MVCVVSSGSFVVSFLTLGDFDGLVDLGFIEVDLGIIVVVCGITEVVCVAIDVVCGTIEVDSGTNEVDSGRTDVVSGSIDSVTIPEPSILSEDCVWMSNVSFSVTAVSVVTTTTGVVLLDLLELKKDGLSLFLSKIFPTGFLSGFEFELTMRDTGRGAKLDFLLEMLGLLAGDDGDTLEVKEVIGLLGRAILFAEEKLGLLGDVI